MLVLSPGNSGLEGVTSNVNSFAVPVSRVAVKEVTGSLPAFLSVISTTGPPGLYGGMGPVTDMISTGSWPEGGVAVAEGDAGVVAGLDAGPQPEAIAESAAMINMPVTMNPAVLFNICFSHQAIFGGCGFLYPSQLGVGVG